MTYKWLLACLFLCSCSAYRMMETDLYFGQSKPGGGMVSEKEWNSFKENYVAKVFKEGSTVINTSGNWYDPDKHQLVTEPTYVIIYFYKRSAQTSRQIDSLRYWYKTMFQQQSVLRVDKNVKTSF
ncbi:MAG: DUF3574 domain-containing protein [Bacteroidota bacterium]|nr:DUF3574 domain-containing protein [Bacteroidota bacterium]